MSKRMIEGGGVIEESMAGESEKSANLFTPLEKTPASPRLDALHLTGQVYGGDEIFEFFASYEKEQGKSPVLSNGVYLIRENYRL